MDTREKIAVQLIAAAVALALIVLFGAGCSAIPVVTPTPVVNVACNWHQTTSGGAVPDQVVEATINDSDCLIDRSSSEAEAQTTGNDNRGVRVDPDVHVPVSP